MVCYTDHCKRKEEINFLARGSAKWNGLMLMLSVVLNFISLHFAWASHLASMSVSCWLGFIQITAHAMGGPRFLCLHTLDTVAPH